MKYVAEWAFRRDNLEDKIPKFRKVQSLRDQNIETRKTESRDPLTRDKPRSRSQGFPGFSDLAENSKFGCRKNPIPKPTLIYSLRIWGYDENYRRP